MRIRFWGTSLSIALLLVAVATAQDKAGEKGKAPAAPPDPKAMMDAMIKAATPGEAHKKLEPLVGMFDVKMKMWMDPAKPADESAGKEEDKWVLGNRYIQTQYTGTFMGQPFNGMGYTGYDNIKKRYVSSWMDTASTGIMSMTAPGASGKTMTFTGSMDDPMSGKPQKFTEKILIADNDHHTMEMWMTGLDGKPFKTMEIQYTRAK